MLSPRNSVLGFSQNQLALKIQSTDHRTTRQKVLYNIPLQHISALSCQTVKWPTLKIYKKITSMHNRKHAVTKH